jgi:hypothetical protein
VLFSHIRFCTGLGWNWKVSRKRKKTRVRRSHRCTGNMNIPIAECSLYSWNPGIETKARRNRQDGSNRGETMRFGRVFQPTSSILIAISGTPNRPFGRKRMNFYTLHSSIFNFKSLKLVAQSWILCFALLHQVWYPTLNLGLLKLSPCPQRVERSSKQKKQGHGWSTT